MVKVIAFDVNETLLDLRALDGAFEDLLGSAALRAQWFAQMLQLSFVGGLTGEYLDFTSAQKSALTMIAQRSGHEVSADDINAMVERMRSLPAHTEVSDALAALKLLPLKIVALTNSVHAVAEEQLTNAGLRPFFDDVISADEVQALKPSPQPYQLVAERFGVAINEVRLVAAHSWDISGALAVGAKAAFVARSGMVLSPVGAQPDIVGADVAEVVRLITTLDL
ncbi:haloacid dehalogenase type II (plasmid) [Coraliomargarita sp. W4R53]